MVNNDEVIQSKKRRNKIKRKTDSKTPIARDVYNLALEKIKKRHEEKLSYREIAEKIKINPSCLWFAINCSRSWAVDRWLAALISLDCVSYQGDHIIINSKAFENYADFFNGIEKF